MIISKKFANGLSFVKIINVVICMYCDRTHEWRATSSRAYDLRNSRKRDL